MSTDKSDRNQKDDQDQFRVSDGAAHKDEYPFIEEFSQFLATVSTPAMKYQLMTYQQRLFARSLWEAENYGGSRSKCEAHLKEIYGPQWHKVTNINQHMTDERSYCEYVLTIDHMRQWDEARKKGKL